jgi:uncharacterized protein YbcI
VTSVLPSEPALPNSAAAQISKAFVQLLSAATGRGPTRARTYITEDVVTVVLHDLLTKAEQILARHGQDDAIFEGRRAMQGILKGDLIAAVEQATGRKVEVFLGAIHLGPDVEVGTFLLEPTQDAPAASA